MRLGNFEVPERGDTSESFDRIYSNKNYVSPESKFLDPSYVEDRVIQEIIFKKE